MEQKPNIYLPQLEPHEYQELGELVWGWLCGLSVAVSRKSTTLGLDVELAKEVRNELAERLKS